MKSFNFTEFCNKLFKRGEPTAVFLDEIIENINTTQFIVNRVNHTCQDPFVHTINKITIEAGAYTIEAYAMNKMELKQ